VKHRLGRDQGTRPGRCVQRGRPAASPGRGPAGFGRVGHGQKAAATAAKISAQKPHAVWTEAGRGELARQPPAAGPLAARAPATGGWILAAEQPTDAPAPPLILRSPTTEADLAASSTSRGQPPAATVAGRQQRQEGDELVSLREQVEVGSNSFPNSLCFVGSG
jgi:hypothetical protein